MDLRGHIYDFLHDPYRTRWPIGRVDYVIEQAKIELQHRAEAYIALRNAKRKSAVLNTKLTKDVTAYLPLVSGKDIYTVEDEELLSIKSVIYDGCFLQHSYNDCNEEPCAVEGKLLKGYSSIGLKKGQIKIFPVPKARMKLCDALEFISKIKPEYEKYVCPVEDDDTVTCNPCELQEGHYETFIDDMYQYGWGYGELEPKKITKFVGNKVKEESDEEESEEEKKPKVEYVNFKLGSLEVVYTVKDVPEFEDNDEELTQELLNDNEAIKRYVCAELLRDDRDDHSRSLGNEELARFDARVALILASYDELYELDDLLEIQSRQGDNVSLMTDELNIQSEVNKVEKAKAKLALHSIDVDHEKLEVTKDDMVLHYDKNHHDKLVVKERTDKQGQRTYCKNRFEELPRSTV